MLERHCLFGSFDAAESISRMLEFFPANYHQQVRAMLASTLRGVISQRLVPAADGGRVAVVRDDRSGRSFGRRVTDWELKGVPVRLERLEAAVAAENGTQVSFEAHGLKGAFVGSGAIYFVSRVHHLRESRVDIGMNVREIPRE